ncbi:MAG: beta-ketoacyl synthase chain length factor [Alphaproteobacteria bacterium]|nr:beta-ketoacyl synthase chain length factor [Alphaproteobacteria bacterium]
MATGAVRKLAWRLPMGVPTEPTQLASFLRSPPLPPNDGWWRLADPERPEPIKPGDWRRASRLARLTLGVVGEILEAAPDLDRRSLPFVYGSAMGEVVPSSAFLDRLFGEGPQFATAFAFQNSVYNATPGHAGHLHGLRGPTETLSAGMATGLQALRRGLDWVEHAEHVLVVVADDLNPTTEAALGSGGGEAVVGVLLQRGEAFDLRDGVHPAEAARARPLPYEQGFVALGLPVVPERAVGACCTNGLVALLAGLDVVDQDDADAITGTWRR